MSNNSPWIAQLKNINEFPNLASDTTSDVVVVGAGIAGISTTYFLLTETDKNVILIDADKIAHGATGHNGGFLAGYFERQISNIGKDFGEEKAIDAQKSIDTAWDLLDEIYKFADLKTPMHQFIGYAGCLDTSQTKIHLQNRKLAHEMGLIEEPIYLASDYDFPDELLNEYKGLYTFVKREEILERLETSDNKFISCITSKKGVLNSALFCHELINFLQNKYQERLTIYENSKVEDIVLYQNNVVLKVGTNKISSSKVVLCTNGFESFSITNMVGEDINKEFHQNVKGAIGYMAAYLEKQKRNPTEISYLPKKDLSVNSLYEEAPYFYLTRRPFELENSIDHDLISIGGPERLLDDSSSYLRSHDYPKDAQIMINDFVKSTYKFAPEGGIDYLYKWHGLMGYTKTGVRVIGPEPKNINLLYNLGCNGVGLLPSIYGGKKISQFINGQKLRESIFDPQK